MLPTHIFEMACDTPAVVLKNEERRTDPGASWPKLLEYDESAELVRGTQGSSVSSKPPFITGWAAQAEGIALLQADDVIEEDKDALVVLESEVEEVVDAAEVVAATDRDARSTDPILRNE